MQNKRAVLSYGNEKYTSSLKAQKAISGICNCNFWHVLKECSFNIAYTKTRKRVMLSTCVHAYSLPCDYIIVHTHAHKAHANTMPRENPHAGLHVKTFRKIIHFKTIVNISRNMIISK